MSEQCRMEQPIPKTGIKIALAQFDLHVTQSEVYSRLFHEILLKVLCFKF